MTTPVTKPTNKPVSFRDMDTLTLARMTYCAIDSPSSVLAERVKDLIQRLERLRAAAQYECDHLGGSDALLNAVASTDAEALR